MLIFQPVAQRVVDSVGFRIESRRWRKRPARHLHALGVGVAGTVFVDVFDTVLMRRTLGSEPAAEVVGLHIGDARYPGARRVAGQRNGTLGEIAASVARTLDTNADRLAEREVEAEHSLCVAVPGAAGWLSQLRRAGKQIVFVSDMHLPADVLGSLLRSNGLLYPEDELVVSSDWGMTKRSGELLPAVVAKLGLDPAEVVHVGNDVVTDGMMPRRAGLATKPVPVANLTRFERFAQRAAGNTANVSSVVGGAARLARLEQGHEAESDADSSLIGVATGVGGTVAVTFLLWTLERARALGLQRLYFLARDGEVLLRMAQALPPAYTDGIELRYLHANRRSVSLAQAAVTGVERWVDRGTASTSARILDGWDRVPYQNLCDRLGLSARTMGELIPELGGVPAEQPLPAILLDTFLSALSDPGVVRAIDAVAAERAELVRGYFAQEGLLNSRAGLVDVGWTGHLAEAISVVARPNDPGSLVHFHLGSLPSSPQPEATIESFLPSAERLKGMVVCLETFTASGSAAAVGFARTANGDVEPVFEADRGPQRPVRASVHAAMIETARQMPPVPLFEVWTGSDAVSHDPLVAFCEDLLVALWEHPTRAEAEALSPLLYESDDAGRVVVGLAEPMRIGRQSGRRVWGAGSVALSSPLIRLVAFARHQLPIRA